MDNLSINKEIEYLSELKIAIAKYEKEKADLEKTNKTFTSENQRLNTENRRLKEEDEKLDLFIKNKNQELLELDEKILKAKIEFEKKNSELYKELKEREGKVANDKALNDLRLKEINKREQKLADKEEELEKIIKEKRQIQADIKEQAKRNEIRNLEILNKEKEINRKETELAEKEVKLAEKEELIENKLAELNILEQKVGEIQRKNSKELVEIRNIKEENLKAIEIISKKNELLKEYLIKVAEKGCENVKIEEILNEKIGSTEVETEVEITPIDLEELTYNELKTKAQELGIEVKGNPKKTDLITSIKEKQGVQ